MEDFFGIGLYCVRTHLSENVVVKAVQPPVGNRRLFPLFHSLLLICSSMVCYI